MAKNFYPDRGKDAWPHGCPCCGEAVDTFYPDDENTYPTWVFKCGADITDVGHPEPLEINDECPEAMRLWIEELTIHRGVSEREDKTRAG